MRGVCLFLASQNANVSQAAALGFATKALPAGGQPIAPEAAALALDMLSFCVPKGAGVRQPRNGLGPHAPWGEVHFC